MKSLPLSIIFSMKLGIDSASCSMPFESVSGLTENSVTKRPMNAPTGPVNPPSNPPMPGMAESIPPRCPRIAPSTGISGTSAWPNLSRFLKLSFSMAAEIDSMAGLIFSASASPTGLSAVPSSEIFGSRAEAIVLAASKNGCSSSAAALPSRVKKFALIAVNDSPTA